MSPTKATVALPALAGRVADAEATIGAPVGGAAADKPGRGLESLAEAIERAGTEAESALCELSGDRSEGPHPSMIAVTQKTLKIGLIGGGHDSGESMATTSIEPVIPSNTSATPQGSEKLSGARADFVAGLGRRKAELRTLHEALKSEPTAKRPRDEMRRKLHALGAGAKLLRFPKLADEVKTLEDALNEAAHRGTLEPRDLDAIDGFVGQMTGLAWGQTTTSGPIRVVSSQGVLTENASTDDHTEIPVSVLCVGNGTLAAGLTDAKGRERAAFEVESTSEPNVAADVARALAPDIIIVDADLHGAKTLVETLVADALTESIPIIVVMRVARADEAGPFLALGVAKVLPKPVSPGELRRACGSVMTNYVRREVSREPLGELTIDELGARLAEELQRGLCDATDPAARTRLMSLGEGTEVLAALWGAVARIRDVVTIKTKGQTRFPLGGPEGAVPLAPWLEETNDREARRSPARSAREDNERSLESLKILVVDDDAAVCWFLAGVLKTAGATVYEARDGVRALEIAKHAQPDIVISDILMPKLDGFGLTRALRHDIVLSDVPIVLLSWKEDLLQRVRELGADADGYLRKEASAGTIVQRVRELARPRARIRQRIKTGTDVRGRLDGLTTFTLMNTVCEMRGDALLSVRDAAYLYEIEVRGSRPVRATRTSLSGAFDRGPSVLGALLGVGDGRFSITSVTGTVEGKPELDGKLLAQLAPVIATARSAQGLLTGENLMRVQRVEIDEDALLSYFGSTPEPAKSLMLALSQGVSPRDLVTSGKASARMLEDVLLDIASHAAVVQVFDASGEDQLPRGIKEEMALLRGERSARPVVELPLITTTAAMPPDANEKRESRSVDLPSSADILRAAMKPAAMVAQPDPSALPPAVEPAKLTTFLDAAGNQTLLGGPAPAPTGNTGAPPVVSTAAPPAVSTNASFLDVHAKTELAAPESPVPPSGLRLTPKPVEAAQVPTIAALVQKRIEENRRASEPVATAVAKPAGPPTQDDSPHGLPQLELTPTPSHMPPPPGVKPMFTLGSLHPPEVMEAPRDVTPKPKSVKKSPSPSEAKERVRDDRPREEASPRVPLPSAYLPPVPPFKRDYKAVYWVGLTCVGLAFALWARSMRQDTRAAEEAILDQTPVPHAQADGAPEGSLSDDPSDNASKSEPSLGRTADPQPEELPLRASDKVKKGHGLLEVVAGKSDTIFVDGKPIGSGPNASVQLKAKPEPYEVRIKTHGEERSRFVQVKEEKLVRVRLAPPWQR